MLEVIGGTCSRQAHGELLTARWWRDVQEPLRAGEVVDVFPCRDEQRLHHARRGT